MTAAAPSQVSTHGKSHNRLESCVKCFDAIRTETVLARPCRALALLLVVALGLAGCARREGPPPEAVSYPGQPVQVVTGTNYAAYPGLPLPPADAQGVVPAPPPRYMGSSTSASSGNVATPEVRRNALKCIWLDRLLDVTDCE